MIRDKNIFECIIKDNHIYFPDYVVWGPPSHGMQRRQHIFKQAYMKDKEEKKVNVSFFERENKNDIWKLRETK